ncbi:MAG: putative Hybrid PKS-NRPS biosynthetic cluster [Geoglossum simile]|nr:MAG: putative Hybrid PKS-NRPS biosynthetic cluster [Geoglossum simile]
MAFQAGGNEPIAIVGSGCRFPGGSNTPSKLWDLLREPRDCLSEIPRSRFNVNGFYHPDNMHHGTSNVRHSYFLSEDHRAFDAQFFGVKATEAHAMDPQQRLLLETVYESVEAAGLTIEGLQGSQTAVYVGLMCADYADLLSRDTGFCPTYSASGTARSIMSNRVSYFFDWHGPSMTIDTACSSSLVAVHHAVQVLRSGESRVAVAAGANLLLGPEQYIAESKLQMLSPGGRSRMWDVKADGYARGEGIAAVVLKTLSAALEDGDHIDCIIRETAVGQDGKTKGITMPSAAAQANLIRATYARAGLDLSKRRDRPQYFEAHGTGTPAGDPIEAEAVSTAFFGPQANFKAKPGPKTSNPDVLFVGSIKTVVGHTEGTAGLAALLKASLALKNHTIPPNLLLDEISPAVEPFYGLLEVPTTAKPWPAVEEGLPRRASVNSFGFGGTNAHAILESYTSAAPIGPPLPSNSGPVYTPFNFSAVSERSLVATIASFSAYLKAEKSTNLRNLSWTLNSRRSSLPVRATFSSLTIDDLCCKLDAFVEGANAKSPSGSTTRPPAGSSAAPRIMGIFTGQGAQWARMGAELMRSTAVQEIVGALERSLAELPDRPSWSLREELQRGAETSRVNEASLSQPLCTAVQIILADLLRSTGVRFEAVVGHSSGEICAAYAAGYLSASDTIRIAYYRGLHLGLAHGLGGRPGSMMACGTTFEDAQGLCSLPAFEGRICVAASNSSTSVTISGDSDAVGEAKLVFEEEGKFARLLKVDRAYHSHHMQYCSEAYLTSLEGCNIKVQRPLGSDILARSWISSVYGEDIADASGSLNSVYWNSNLVSPVLFSQAVECAMGEKGPFDVIVEIGPHPALKGPTTQTIQDISGQAVPYTGILRRGRNDIEAVADCLGFLWASLAKPAVDIAGYERLVSGGHTPSLLTGLPPYPWDERVFWHEARISRAFRDRGEPTHELLGIRCPDGAERHIRWSNILHPREIPWLIGHQIQGQIIFPGTGYVSTALEAVRAIAGKEPMKLIELQDVVFGQALVFDDEETGVEIMFTLTDVVRDDRELSANFFYYSPESKGSTAMTLNANGRIQATFGRPSADILPPRPEPGFALTKVESERFYSFVGEFGYGYTGPFRALSSLERKLGVGTGLISTLASDGNRVEALMIHPATLDCAIQSTLLAFCYPGDSRLWSIQLPIGVDRIRVNPSLCTSRAGRGASLPFNSSVSEDRAGEIDGDVEVYAEDGLHTMIQVEGIHTKPLLASTEATDLPIFSELVWGFDSPKGIPHALDSEETKVIYDLSFTLERVAYFQLRSLARMIPREQRETAEGHHQMFFVYTDHVLEQVADGKHPYVNMEWTHDTHDQILAIAKKYPDSIDLKLMAAIGENMPRAVRGEITMLEPMMQNNMLTDFYVKALGMDEYLSRLASMSSHIGHRYPQMNVLEIGAGTGGATKAVLRQLNGAFSSYTYTDISSGFFQKAQEVFKPFESKMTFKVLDIEKDVASQGFTNYSFDVVIASLVLHATSKLEETMRNVRKLLKPGGYLLMMELTDNETLRFPLIFGGLPGWWLGGHDGRQLSPCVSLSKWEAIMLKTGFSSIDAIVPHFSDSPVPLSVIATQAVDNRVNFLRRPLSWPASEVRIPQLSIIGGVSRRTSEYVGDVTRLLAPHCGQISHFESLADLSTSEISFAGSVLCLNDLDESIFKSLTDSKLKGFQQLFKQSKSVLWITQGLRDCDPYAKMVIGFGRNIGLEMSHLRLQFIDTSPLEKPDPKTLAEAMLRFEAADVWKQQGFQQDSLLWTVEREMAIENGRQLVPRLQLSKAQNDRYNSIRRPISREVDLKTCPISVLHSRSSFVVQEAPGPIIPGSTGNVVLQTAHSLLQSVRINSTEYLFLMLGTKVETGEQVLALTKTQSSLVEVPVGWTIPCLLPPEQGIQLMLKMFYQLMALALLSDMSNGQTLVALDTSESMATTLSRRAAEKGVNLVCLTTTSATKGSLGFSIHPHAPKRVIKAAIPRNTSRFLASADKMVSGYIASCLPPLCKVESLDTLTGRETRVGIFDPFSEYIPQCLRTSCILSQVEHSPVDVRDVPPVTLREVPNIPKDDAVRLINWTACPTVLAKVEPIDSKPMFADDRTYWLVGLTGGLGLSLCRWMVSHGAKYIVVSSRNPKVDKRWLECFRSAGATVIVYPRYVITPTLLRNYELLSFTTPISDITSRDSLKATYNRICSSLPPIAGVTHGAMVLHDTVFLDLDMEKIQKVLQPKMEGSVYLDELFADTKLDHFVFLSSMASITGNPGQSAYGAASLFMAGIAGQRRKRGLAASTVYVGAIVGNGYVTRELNLQQQIALRKAGNVWMSEQDFHQIFAEAVASSPPRPGPNPEFSTGLRIYYTSEDVKPTWYTNPVFSHLLLQRENTQAVSGGSTATTSVKSQLLLATTADEVFDILKGKYQHQCILFPTMLTSPKASFVAKLQATLQADPDMDMMDLSADALGIDSLVAVDVRSWFFVQINVDMPVLKILSGATVRELLVRAQGLLPPAVVPGLGAGGASTPAIAKPEIQKVRPVLPTSGGPANPTVESSDGLRGHITPETRGLELATDPESLTGNDKQITPLIPLLTDRDTPTSSTRSSLPETETSLGNGYETIASSHPSSGSSTMSLVEETTKAPVSRDAVERTVPMSFGQSRFWFLRFYLGDKSTFNVTSSLRLVGSLRIADLARAVETVGHRHESLRTRFFTDENHQPMQSVLVSSTLSLEQRQISDGSEVAEEYQRMKDHVYDLENGETMRIVLLILSPTHHRIILGYHHINMDGISFEIFFSDLEKAYNGSLFPSSFIQYPDFAIRQRREFLAGRWDEEMDFWRKEFPDIPQPISPAPISRVIPRPTLTKYRTHMTSFRVPSKLSSQIQDLCRRLKVSPFQVYLAVYRAMLFRLLDTDDLCIGVADANRNESDTLQSLGCYLNLLPIRFRRPDPRQTVSEVLKETKAKSQQAFANSQVPFDALLAELGVPRSPSHSPLFQVFLNYRQGIQENRTFAGCESDWVEFDGGQIPYDISIDVIDNLGGDALIRLSVQTALYTSDDAGVLIKIFVNLLNSFSTNPASRLGRLVLYSEEDTQTAVNLGQAPASPSDWPDTLLHRVDAIVEEYGQNASLKDGLGNVLTYDQMAKRVGSIATALLSIKVGPGSRVGVFQEPTTDWICSMVAIMRLGAAYVPLDPRIATMRLAAIVEDCQPRVILVNDAENTSNFIALSSKVQLINVSTLPLLSNVQPVPNFASLNAPAVILYTSGSTGVPKGIVLTHENIKTHVEMAAKQWLTRAPNETVLQQSSFSFDMSVAQSFDALCSGGTLYIVPQMRRGDSAEIARIIIEERVTYTLGTPSEYLSWLRRGNSKALKSSQWKVACSGGEKITQTLKREFRALGKPELRLFDCYGPTETSFCSHTAEISYADDKGGSGETGSALRLCPNYSVCIVDDSLKPVPVGVLGELLIGGIGVASGYLGNTELNSQKFLPNTFASPEFVSRGWTTMHRTGDQGRFLSDGSLVLEGRISGDTQIKLRGLRIDLQDIEATIVQASNGQIAHAIVSARQAKSQNAEFLVAHVMFSTDPHEPHEDRDRFLKQLLINLPLPRYMHPAVIIPLDSMPLTASSKLDRLAIDALPLPRAQPSNPHSLELGETETKLKQLWDEVIPKEVARQYTIDANTDFFQVGGSSLLLVGLQALIKTEFDVHIPLSQLFDASTLGRMAARIGDDALVLEKELVDWERETSLLPEISQLTIHRAAQASPIHKPKVIVLTGATGFLGGAILNLLIKDKSVETIHCIAVRKNPTQLPRLFASAKVVAHQGDLALPRLGLSVDEAATIFSEADIVIHNGAEVSFMKTYETLKPANLQSTKELVALCLPYNVQFHYISTVAVTYFSGLDTVEEVSMSQYLPPCDGSDGYACTKWASERYLEKVHEQVGLPVWIHRPSSILGDDAPALDIMSNMLTYSLQMQAVPKSAAWSGTFDFISVEKAAEDIVLSTCRENPAGMTYLFESGEVIIPITDMDQNFAKDTGMQMQVLPATEWADRAETLGMDSLVASYFRKAVLAETVMPKLIRKAGERKIDLRMLMGG